MDTTDNTNIPPQGTTPQIDPQSTLPSTSPQAPPDQSITEVVQTIDHSPPTAEEQAPTEIAQDVGQIATETAQTVVEDAASVQPVTQTTPEQSTETNRATVDVDQLAQPTVMHKESLLHKITAIFRKK